MSPAARGVPRQATQPNAPRNPPDPSTSIPGVCSSPSSPNPGFEDGSSPPNGWTVSTAGAAAYHIDSPGSSRPGGGQYALVANLAAGSTRSSVALSTLVSTCTNRNYSASIDFKIDTQVGGANPFGDCAIVFSYPQGSGRGSEIYGSNVPGTQYGVWTFTYVLWQAPGPTSEIGIEMRCDGQSERFSVDNLVYNPYAGNVY